MNKPISLKKTINLAVIINKKNGQMNFSFPKKKLPLEIKNNLAKFKSIKIEKCKFLRS